MAKSSSDKKQKVAARTTAITPNTLTSILTSFSPISSNQTTTTSFYAHLHRAPDAHTLRIYEANTGKCTSRWASNAIGDEEEQRVASITWTFIPAAVVSADSAIVEGGEDASKRGKKRRKSDSTADETPVVEATKNQPKLVLALGLENGSILLWSPNGTSPVILSHPTSTSSITGLTSPSNLDGTLSSGHLWSAHSDGSVKVWDLASSSLINTVAGLAEGIHWDDLAVRYLPLLAEGKKRTVQLLLSHLSLHVYSLSIGSPKKDKIKELKANEIGRCTGHIAAGSVKWINLSPKSNDEDAIEEDSDSDDNETSTTSSNLSFLSYCPSDRFVQIWSLPLTASRIDGALVARLALDSGVQSIAIGESPLNEDEKVLAAVDSIGKVSLTRLPNVIPVSSGGTKGRTAGIFVLQVESEIVGVQGVGTEITRVNFIAEAGKMEICRGGVKPSFNVMSFVEENGSWIPKMELNKLAVGLLNGNSVGVLGAPLPTRYVEPVNSTVSSGNAIAELNSDDEAEVVNSGELDVDMAEPTLADRLKSMNVNKSRSAITNRNEGSDVDDEEDDGEEEEETSGPIVPATTLTTTLIQALHSSDAPLLESCLVHTSPSLIRSTVKRLPSGNLVLSFLELLVERLGRGKKGSQGNASVKRARGLIEWVRQVLIVHVGFLVTIPSLVTRLSTLHASLTSRLALQPTLLALNGRLELVISQIDLRQQRAAERASIAAPRNARGKKYIEGESSDEDGDDSEGEGGDSDEGSVEDVVLGTDEEGDSDEEEDEDDDGMGFDSEDGEFDDEDDEDEDSFQTGVKPKGAKVNGGRKASSSRMSDLLELEASEDEEDSEDDSEDGESDSDEDEDDD